MIEVPPQTGLRLRLDVSPADAVRVRFQAGPEPGQEPSVIGGAIRVLLRVREVAMDGTPAVAWREVGELRLEVTAVAPWRRVEQATFPLGFVAAGVADIELRTEGAGLQGPVVAGLQDLELVSQTGVRRRAATDGGTSSCRTTSGRCR